MNSMPLRFNSLIVGEVGGASPFEDLVVSKLVRVLGKEKAAQLLDSVLGSAGLQAIDSVQELLMFSNELIKHAGFAAVVARSLKVYAILRGAVE
jgi:hypothetical protein